MYWLVVFVAMANGKLADPNTLFDGLHGFLTLSNRGGIAKAAHDQFLGILRISFG